MRTSAHFFLPRRRFAGRFLVALTIALVCACAGRGAPPASSNEIIVSAANYAQATPDELQKLFHRPQDLVDAAPPPPSAHPVRLYQFLASEPLDADLPFIEVCRLLRPVLAAKNLLNTTEPKQAELVLRVTFGGRRWRDPTVREDDLTWRDGLVPKRRRTTFDAGAAWDQRAGGDEASLYNLERDLVAISPGAEGMADSMIAGVYTEDYYLIVVDAFEVATLRKKGNDTPRAWTTFIAVPRRPGVKFSDVAARMITKAAPYFGETLPGKARFTDRDGNVKVGEPRVIEDNKNAAPAKK
jgi:hypothetical protein